MKKLYHFNPGIKYVGKPNKTSVYTSKVKVINLGNNKHFSEYLTKQKATRLINDETIIVAIVEIRNLAVLISKIVFNYNNH